MFLTTHRSAKHSAISAVCSKLAVAYVALACALLAGPMHAAADTKPAPQTAKREQLTIAPQEAMKPWTGDLDAIVERRVIRILTVYSKTFYFVDKGIQRGARYDIGSLFVDDLNKKLAKDNKLQQKHIMVRAMFIPVARGELLQALVGGKGDIVMSSFGVSEERQKLVDFSSPLIPDVTEVLVSGPGSTAVSSIDDLAGKQIFVRKSSTYYESLVSLNRHLAAEGKPAAIIKEAPQTLEDEDLIEMVNVGLIPLTVTADFTARFWKQVLPKITVHEGITLRTGGNIPWAIRKGSPQLKTAIDDFVSRNGSGTSIANQVMARYFRNAKYVKDASSEA